jgi:hypothetical protein
MRRASSFRQSVGLVSVAAVSLWLGYTGSAQTPAQKAAQTKTDAMHLLRIPEAFDHPAPRTLLPGGVVGDACFFIDAIKRLPA